MQLGQLENMIQEKILQSGLGQEMGYEERQELIDFYQNFEIENQLTQGGKMRDLAQGLATELKLLEELKQLPYGDP